MRFSDQSHNLRIELDTKNFEFSSGELEKLEEHLAPLRDPVRNFPVSDMYITVVYHPTPHDFHVRTSLVLPGRTLFTGERDDNALSAWSRCVRKLVTKVTAYKDQMDAKSERAKSQKGTAQEVIAASEPDVEHVRASVEQGDYPAFREAMYVYEEAVRKRAGRWIERYPEFERRLGVSVSLEDLVEEVFLNAFERFDQRPEAVRIGRWLEDLIDPSVNALLKDPETERENIEAVRTLREASDQQRD
jgi:ribosome-associated translation inhibitor RaiA